MNLGVFSLLFEFIGASIVGMTAVCMLIRLSNMDKIKANKLHKKQLYNRNKNTFVNVDRVA